MGSNFWIALTTSLLAAITTTIGIYTIRHFETWGRKQISYFTCFASGVLISASFLHIVPKSFAMNSYAPTFILVGYIFMHQVLVIELLYC